jgi:hypothetical protein
LKNNSRVGRSLSESSVDDYVWSSSVDMATHSGSESRIPEETAEEEREAKKTVRFNEVVSQKTYRFVNFSFCRNPFNVSDRAFCSL